ncbi:MAG: lipopolysaccharide biosynthesis protein [Bacteroidales bacterium]|nr:lipopolysaccharide biosynthesis protein [Bacteroidales bacterium]
MKSVKEETLQGVKWSALEKASVLGIQFILGLIMARLLSPGDYGTVGMLSIFFAISQTFIDSGFANALIRKPDSSESDYCTAFYFNILVSIVCYSILFVIAPLVADFFHSDILCRILRIQAVSLIFNSLVSSQLARLKAALNFKALALRTFFVSVLSGVCGVILAYIGFGVWALVAQTVLSSLFNCIFIFAYCRWLPGASFSRSSFKYLWNYGSKLMASGLLNTFYTNLTPLIIGRHFTSGDLGYYSRGTSFASYPASIVKGILSSVTFPIFSKIQEDTDRLVRVYRKYICVTSLAIFFGCTLMAAIGKPLVLLLLTEKWESCVIYLQIFCFSAMFDHICSINLNLLQVTGRSDLFLRLEVIKKAIAITILFAAIPFGVIGICISKIIYTQIAMFINTHYTGKLFGLSYLTQVKDFSGFLALSILSCLPAYLFTFLDYPPVVALAFGFVSAPLIYWLMLRKNPYMKECLGIIKDKVSLLFSSKQG